MRITNKQNLPAPLVRAVTYSDRQRGESEFTVTELVQPPRIGALRLKHDAELEEDASDRLWMLIGSAAHEVLRRSAPDCDMVEQRLKSNVENGSVSGQTDLIDSDIVDYKLCSIYVVKDGVKPEWEAQINCYRWLAMKNGHQPEAQYIIAIFRDWSLSESKRNSDYPQSQVMVLPVKIWTYEFTEGWISGRIARHKAARAGQLPDCTPEETWERPAKWAVKKKGAARATKLYDNELDAATHAAGSGLELEFRPGERPRCENYCPVSEFCDQYKKWKGQLL